VYAQIIVKVKPRNSIKTLFPLVLKTRPRRCQISGETQKHQTPYPPPWLNSHKDFNNPKSYPLEIDHINIVEWDSRPQNLRWLTKLHHIEWTQMTFFPTRRPTKKGAPTRKSGRFASWE